MLSHLLLRRSISAFTAMALAVTSMVVGASPAMAAGNALSGDNRRRSSGLAFGSDLIRRQLLLGAARLHRPGGQAKLLRELLLVRLSAALQQAM